MTKGTLATEFLEVARQYPISMHCVGLSLGSIGVPEPGHLAKLRRLVDIVDPDLISDHLSWSAIGAVHLPDLLPLPYTQEALRVVVRNIQIVQESLQHKLLIENPSRYSNACEPELPECEFLAEVVLRTGCGVLLDVNNLYVTAKNIGQQPEHVLEELLEKIYPEDIGEIHVAGHEVMQDDEGAVLLVDTHGKSVCEEVWQLLGIVVTKLGPRPTLIEWDTNLPHFEVLLDERARADKVLGHYLLETVDE